MGLQFPIARSGIPIMTLGVSLAWVLPAIGGEHSVVELNQLKMTMGLVGGLALFLFGMDQMAEGLKAAVGQRMKDILSRLTKNRFTAALTGAFVTTVIQSSSVTTVLVVGFVSAGLMTMAQSIGIIMGANVGTTVTAQIVAFKVEEAALAMIAGGFGMQFVSKRDQVQHYGNMVMGLGLVFFGMRLMGDGMDPFRHYQPFLDLMGQVENPFLGILVAGGFTALVQSSSATTGIIIVLASQGFITLEAGIALAFGGNIGTCVTALLAALGKSREALRAALVHVMFNIMGVLVWLPFITQLANLVLLISPVYPELTGSERLGMEVPRQIANAHSVFNLINTLLFIGFTTSIARLVYWLIPHRPEPEDVLIRPVYLDESLIPTPDLALGRVRLELGHMGKIVQKMFAEVPDVFQKKDHQVLETISKMDDQVDVLQTHILRYLGQIRKQKLTDEQSHEFQVLMNSTDYLEHIGDIIETDIVRIGKHKIAQGIQASEMMNAMLLGLFSTVSQALKASVQAVRDNNQQAAQEVVALKEMVDHQINEALAHQAGRLVEDEPNRIALFRMEMDSVDSLKRVHTLAKRIARQVLPVELARA